MHFQYDVFIIFYKSFEYDVEVGEMCIKGTSPNFNLTENLTSNLR